MRLTTITTTEIEIKQSAVIKVITVNGVSVRMSWCETLDKGMTHVPAGSERGGRRFYHTTQEKLELQNRRIVCVWNFPFHMFRPRSTTVTEATEGETAGEGARLHWELVVL